MKDSRIVAQESSHESVWSTPADRDEQGHQSESSTEQSKRFFRMGHRDSPWPWQIASAAALFVVLILAVVLLAQFLQTGELFVRQAGLRVRSVSVPRGAGTLQKPPVVPSERSVDVYRGYGAWVDVYDYSPPYAGDFPAITPSDLEEMASEGVKTLYLQAARMDSRSPDGIQDRWLLAEMLIGAHEKDIAVVAWYLPKWELDGRDLERIRLLEEYEVLGHRFDGVAVDIEWIEDGLTAAERSARLLAFSRLAVAGIDGPVGAIVPPPVQIEVVNPRYWPDFPWAELAPLYDVWLPMSYWSFRSEPYGDGYTYHEESVRRLRANLGDPEALVHGIGGIGGIDAGNEQGVGGGGTQEPLASLEEIKAFMKALEDSESIGGSIYDWRTLSPSVRTELSEYFSG